jgi:FAD:protein FMN transferase
MKVFSTWTLWTIWTACLVLFIHGLSIGEEKPILRVMQHIAMNADVELVMYGDPDMDPEALVEVGRAVFDAIDRLEGKISRWKADSYTSLVNRAASKQPVVVAQELMDVLLESRRYYEATDGVFDVTVGPLLERWGFYAKHGGTLPTQEELAQIRERIGFNHVVLDPAKRTVFFDKPDMRIDFGGIGKGLALDYAAAIIRENGVKSARMHIGTSTIIAIGTPPGKTGWTVDIRSPYNTGEDAYIATIDIRDESLSTSSRTERFVEIDGRKYGHIIDPRTGVPADEVLSATAIAPTGLDSDALSTAFYILGVEKTRKYCELHPEVRAMLVVEKDAAPETIYVNFNKQKE